MDLVKLVREMESLVVDRRLSPEIRYDQDYFAPISKIDFKYRRTKTISDDDIAILEERIPMYRALKATDSLMRNDGSMRSMTNYIAEVLHSNREYMAHGQKVKATKLERRIPSIYLPNSRFFSAFLDHTYFNQVSELFSELNMPQEKKDPIIDTLNSFKEMYAEVYAQEHEKIL
jgi:hypothetical protein